MYVALQMPTEGNGSAPGSRAEVPDADVVDDRIVRRQFQRSMTKIRHEAYTAQAVIK
jgi:hypothetical protein